MLNITDAHLLRIDPHMFVDAADAAGTVLLDTDDAVTDGESLTTVAADFEEAGIEAGHVVVLTKGEDVEVLEVIARDDAQSLTVSRPRAAADGPLIAPDAQTNWLLRVVTFARLVDTAATDLLVASGLDDASAGDSGPSLDSVLHIAPLEQLVVLWARMRARVLAAARSPDDESQAASSVQAQREFHAAWARTLIVLDLDGDGVADATRRLGVPALRR